MSAPSLPCAGLTVVEVVVGTSDLGLGLASALPGRILADMGANVTRVVGAERLDLDRDLPWGRPWHRGKSIIATDDAGQIAALLAAADVALVYGTDEVVEARGLGYIDTVRANPAIVYGRCRPSRTCEGVIDDFGLLVEARAGLLTQLAGHRPGPIFIDTRSTGIGAATLLATSVLALLCQREWSGGYGGWAETSLYDGMLSTLGCMIGRSERAAPEIEGYWEKGSTFPNFLYRCADGELIQVWFGGKGMYAKLIAVLGDEPSDNGYYSDQVTGRLQDRARRWVTFFAQQPRDVWVQRLRETGVACEPVNSPGEELRDPHLAEIGLAVPETVDGHRDIVLGTPISIRAFGVDAPAAKPVGGPRGILDGLRVVDFSAFVAGPLAAQILADLGAEVIKVEPPEGEAMRAAAYAVAACQRGKSSLAMDINAPEARPVLDELLRSADVVLHNFRVGVAERLGIDEATVARLNPNAVYCHASAFGATGRRAKFPGNDALMQAVTGLERGVGGVGNDPIAATWIPIDMCGGWMAAIGTLAGLLARARGGHGQQVGTSLLGAGMLLHSGVYERDGELVRGPELDGEQTGYGPGYRIYRGSDDEWFALVVPSNAVWQRLRTLPGAAALPEQYAPLRCGASYESAGEAERVLASAFAAEPAAVWVQRLHELGAAAEPVRQPNRDTFRQGILDDPINRQLGRAITYQTSEWGDFDQVGPLLRYGPAQRGGPRLRLPGIGEDSVEVLDELGVEDDTVEALLASKVVRRPEAWAPEPALPVS